MKVLKRLTAIAYLLIISACSTDPRVISDSAPKHIPVDIHAIPNAVPRHEPRTRAGNPGTYEVLGKTYKLLPDSRNYIETGIASWYGSKFHGRKTSNGETYDMFAMTAAHKTLPIPCYVQVTNLRNKKSIVVRVNDRGPFHDNRIIDLSYTAAAKLGIQQQGTGFVEVRTIEPSQTNSPGSITQANPAGSALYLQIGAFSQQANAIELQNQVNAYQLPAPRVRTATVDGSSIFKVQLGPIDTVTDADRIVQLLATEGIHQSHLVID